jgi:hypothetical protein
MKRFRLFLQLLIPGLSGLASYLISMTLLTLIPVLGFGGYVLPPAISSLLIFQTSEWVRVNKSKQVWSVMLGLLLLPIGIVIVFPRFVCSYPIMHNQIVCDARSLRTISTVHMLIVAVAAAILWSNYKFFQRRLKNFEGYTPHDNQ